MSLDARRSTVAVIGLGNLGLAMATNLAARGWNVSGLDSSASRMALLREAGGSATAPDRLHGFDALCFVVPDDSAIREVLTGTPALLTRLGPEQIVLVHSTVLPARVRDLAGLVKRTGAGFLDVPVSGGAERAGRGELTVFAGGDEEDLRTAAALLDAVGREVFHLGPVGAGAATKLANQLVMFGALSSLYEALTLTEANGVAESDVLRALATGTADTWVGRNWGFFDRTADDYNRAGVPQESRPWRKDLEEIAVAARDSDLELPLAELIRVTVADEVESRAAEYRSKQDSGHAPDPRPGPGRTSNRNET
ncbi:NAD(P)-dependent oxidoreductase [Amnibacterium sp.]|uniref:NAD(P)-dependent oxidoreductase n=1 Tax=Amnibacterium sp. TaxID=1872496 RepID=UPI002602FE35|nr:NAD(P)-dependent oxidoreductase [Amnibacterium sp.]MCU1472803.1 6-phosphogluconate dehydrogenase NAD-binding protein [Amnibacterium sp.]